MNGIIIEEPLATRLRQAAEYHQSSPEVLVARLLENFSPAPRPASSLKDAYIEIPPDIEDAQAYREAVRQVRPKLYRLARQYWEQTGDYERLALSDDTLDQVFWCIDHEGIPRLLEEKATLHLPPDPMDAFFRLGRESLK